MRISRIAVGLFALPVFTLLAAQSATVSGTITAGKATIAPKSGVAVGYTAPNGKLISVLLSDKPADSKAFGQLTKVGAGEPLVPGIFEGAWKSMHIEKKLSGFVFTLDSNRRIVSNEFLVGGKNDTFSVSEDDLVLEVKTMTPRLAGRIRTKEPTLSLGGQQVGLDVTFDVAVTAVGN